MQFAQPRQRLAQDEIDDRIDPAQKQARPIATPGSTKQQPCDQEDDEDVDRIWIAGTFSGNTRSTSDRSAVVRSALWRLRNQR